MNNPFCYEPHPLCLKARGSVIEHIEGDAELKEDAETGKMFGVLIVERLGDEPLPAECHRLDIGKLLPSLHNLGGSEERCFFIAAYSGLLAGRNDHPYFVPPIYDAQQEDGHFKTVEREISAINRQLEALPVSDQRGRGGRRIETPERMELKQRRKAMSEELQRWLFTQYNIMNARGETATLLDVFERSAGHLPPGGTGDCCAPKLLQFAYQHQLRPLAIAEFWYGESKYDSLRRHRHFYPACNGKCRHILGFMMQGIEVEPEALLMKSELCPKVVFEDDWMIIVDKPAGLLSVPGRVNLPSVTTLMREARPDLPELTPAHRLDMATSGLMILAKTKAGIRMFEQMFTQRQIRKEYIAILETTGSKLKTNGFVALPLMKDIDDTPRQKVDYDNGKDALTEYQLLDSDDEAVKSLFPKSLKAPQQSPKANHQEPAPTFRMALLKPLTGRTHQLRIHCAHPDGLDSPIVGDPLYGNVSDRLYLHASRLSFTHPVTQQRIDLNVAPDW